VIFVKRKMKRRVHLKNRAWDEQVPGIATSKALPGKPSDIVQLATAQSSSTSTGIFHMLIV
jgi:hypothetical protein